MPDRYFTSSPRSFHPGFRLIFNRRSKPHDQARARTPCRPYKCERWSQPKPKPKPNPNPTKTKPNPPHQNLSPPPPSSSATDTHTRDTILTHPTNPTQIHKTRMLPSFPPSSATPLKPSHQQRNQLLV